MNRDPDLEQTQVFDLEPSVNQVIEGLLTSLNIDIQV